MGLEGVQAPSFDPEPPTGTRKDWWCLSRLEEGHYKVSAVRQEAPRKLGTTESQHGLEDPTGRLELANLIHAGPPPMA